MEKMAAENITGLPPTIPSLSLDVFVKGVVGLTSGTETCYQGTGTLEVNSSGMRMSSRKTGKLLSLSVKESYGGLWHELKEIKDQLVTKKRFHANFGKGKNGNDILVWIILQGEAAAKAAELSTMLNQLAPEASLKKCPACGGVVENGICRNCGKSFKDFQRQKGLLWLIGGILMFAAGWILTGRSEKATSGGSSITIYIGLLAIGAVLAIIGIIKIISGKR